MKKIFGIFGAFAMVLALGMTLVACCGDTPASQIFIDYISQEGIVTNLTTGAKVTISDTRDSTKYTLSTVLDAEYGLQFAYECFQSNELIDALYLQENYFYVHIADYPTDDGYLDVRAYEYFDESYSLEYEIRSLFEDEYAIWILDMFLKATQTENFLISEIKELDNVGGSVEMTENNSVTKFVATGDFNNGSQRIEVQYTDGKLTKVKDNFVFKGQYANKSFLIEIEPTTTIAYPDDLDEYEINMDEMEGEEVFQYYTDTEDNFTNYGFIVENVVGDEVYTSYFEFDENGLKTAVIDEGDSQIYLVDGMVYYHVANEFDDDKYYKREYNPDAELDDYDVMYYALYMLKESAEQRDFSLWTMYSGSKANAEFYEYEVDTMFESYIQHGKSVYTCYIFTEVFIIVHSGTYNDGKLESITSIQIYEGQIAVVSLVTPLDEEIAFEDGQFDNYEAA